MFRKDLRGMIDALRNPSVQNAAALAGKMLDDIKKELKSTSAKVKATAMSKLIYLKLLGHDIRWASFHIIEVMSLPQFRYKRIGYLAAEQVFNKDTDVVLLANNLLKKQLAMKDPYEVTIVVIAPF